MDEPGEEGQREPAPASPLPEGGSIDAPPAAGAPQGVRLQAFQGQSQSASNLDMLLDLDEPELFMREVVMRAGAKLTQIGRARERWAAIVDGGRKILDRLEALNAPAQR